MWQDITNVHPKLQVTASQGKAVFLKIAELCEPVWKRNLTSDERKTYPDVMSRRYRTMAKHINATLVKHPDTAWIIKLLGDLASSRKTRAAETGDDPEDEGAEEDQAEEEGGEEEDKEGDDEERESEDEQGPPNEIPASQPRGTKKKAVTFAVPSTALATPLMAAAVSAAVPSSSPEAAEYFYGYDFELHRAWRSREPVAGKKHKKDWARELLTCDGLHPLAYWEIGSSGVEIKTVTCKELAEAKQAASGNSKPCIWSGLSPTGLKLRIARFLGIRTFWFLT